MNTQFHATHTNVKTPHTTLTASDSPREKMKRKRIKGKDDGREREKRRKVEYEKKPNTHEILQPECRAIVDECLNVLCFFLEKRWQAVNPCTGGALVCEE